MRQETYVVEVNSSAKVKLGNLVLSVRKSNFDKVELVVGHPGLPNIDKALRIGEAVLFETPDDGILEVRALATNHNRAELLVSQVSPRLGIAGGLVIEDPNNSPFTPSELIRIADSLKSIGVTIRRRSDVAPEQLELIQRKLDEMEAASRRLGRKDWITYVAGTLTSICVSAAFAPDVSKALFQSANSALSWLFYNALQLLA